MATMVWKRKRGVVPALALSLATCGVDSRKPPVSDTGYCANYVEAAIARQATCDGVSRDALEVTAMTVDFCSIFSAAQAAGAIVVDSAAAEACLHELANAPCGVDTPSCRRAFVGQLGAGAPCYPLGIVDAIAQECAPGFGCMQNQCPGTCVRYAKLGEHCSTDRSVGPTCDPSLDCDYTSKTCVPGYVPPAIGDACPAMPCESLVCVGPNGPLAPTESAGGTCQPPSASGPCYYDSDCIGRCVGATPPSGAGTCSPWKQIGDPCTPGARECARGTYCGVDSSCTLLPSVGETCAGNQGEGTDCLDGWCSGGLCVALGSPGDLCMTSGLFNDTCGGVLSQCDRTLQICLPTCSRVTTCGAAGQTCCAGELCASGSSCVAGTCAAAP